MNFSRLIDLYNSSDMSLSKFFVLIGKELGMDISYNCAYWFSSDIKHKNKMTKPISLLNIDNSFHFLSDEYELFTINKKTYQQFNSNDSLLRTSLFPTIDDTGCSYDIHNDQFILGSNGLYEMEDLLFNKYRYITFTGKNKIYYEAFVDKEKETILKIYYDKYGDVDSKYFYNFKKKNKNIDSYTYACNRIEEVLDTEFPRLTGTLYKQTYADLVDQYFYDIELTNRIDKYRDLYITNGTKFTIKDKEDGIVQGFSIESESDRNKENYIALSNPSVSDLKLLCVTDFVNGSKINKSLSKYITLELNKWFCNLDGNSLKDEKLLLAGLRDKILEVNRYIFNEVNIYRKKNKNRRDDLDKVIGSSMGLSLITKNNTYFLNYGDTRIYSTFDDKLSRLTIDNTIVWDNFVKGNYTYDEACAYQRRSLLTNYVGNPDKYLELPELYIINNDKYDKLFVLSDGVTDSLGESTISNIIQVNDGSETLRTIAIQAHKHQRRQENVTGCCYIKK